MPSSVASPIVRELDALLKAEPTAELLLFVPRPQIGLALQDAVASVHRASMGFTALTPLQYAEDYASVSLRADGQTELTPSRHFFLVAEAVRYLPPEQQSSLTGGRTLSGVLRPLSRSITTLRSHAITPDTYRNQIAPTPHRKALGAAYHAYEQLRSDRDVYDTADVFTRATQLIEADTVDVSSTRVAVLKTVSLSEREYTFISSLAHHSSTGGAPYTIGPRRTNKSLEPPSTLAEAYFPDGLEAPCVNESSGIGRVALDAEAPLDPTDATSIRFWTATGTRREIRAVLEDVVTQGYALDSVEIAYTTPDPYLGEIDILTERYDLPVSLSGGRSIEATRPGQLLEGFYDWVANGCTIPDLIPLLRSGLLRTEGAAADEDTDHSSIKSRRVAAVLTETRYPDAPREYDAVFDTWIAGLETEIQNLDGSNTEEPWIDRKIQEVREKKETVEIVATLVDDLLDLAHITSRTAVSIKEMARSGEVLLERFGPTEKPVDSDDDHTPDEAARNRLIERLRALTNQKEFSAYNPRRLAALLRSWISLDPFVRAQHPRPGHAHVVPLESAGYTNREHLYVVGLDANATQSRLPDDPLLSDVDRRALSDANRRLSLRRNRVDREDWLTRRALARHTGTLTMSACTYDLTENEEIFEAPLFHHLKNVSQSARAVERDEEDPQVSHFGLASHSRALSDLDRWTDRQRPTPAQLEETLTCQYPWIGNGLRAADARASATYTVYDGLLALDSYRGLDPLSHNRPLSVGQLERYVRSPYAYFLRHILGVEPHEEPALDDVAWLDAKGKGAVLHRTFRTFMTELQRAPTLEDEDLLREHFDAALTEKRDALPPPSEVIYATTKRQLWTNALVFLRIEAHRSENYTPWKYEAGFGYPDHRHQENDYPEAPTLHLDGVSLSLRGRVDRIDRLADDTLCIWDYKTGSARSYDESDLLNDGKHLQWALYAYALEEIEGDPVSKAGYFFTSTGEMGRRIAASPNEYRSAVARTIQQISEGTASGAFPLTDSDALRYNYNELFHNYQNRRKYWTAKEWPADRPAPPSLVEE